LAKDKAKIFLLFFFTMRKFVAIWV